MKKFISTLVLSGLIYLLFKYYILYALILWGVVEILIYGTYKRKFFKFSLNFIGSVVFGLLYLFDVACNVLFQVPLNRIMVQNTINYKFISTGRSGITSERETFVSEPYKFGHYKDTISRVLGIAERDGHLTKTGDFFVRFLNWIEKDHCKKSI